MFNFNISILLNGLASVLLMASVLFALPIGADSDTYFFTLSVATFITATFLVPLRSFIIINSQASDKVIIERLSSVIFTLLNILYLSVLILLIFQDQDNIAGYSIIIIIAILIDQHATSVLMSQSRLQLVEVLGFSITIPFIMFIFIQNPELTNILLTLSVRSYILGTCKGILSKLKFTFALQEAGKGVTVFVQLYWSNIAASLLIKNERLLLQYFAIDQMSGLATSIALSSYIVTGVNTFLNRRFGNKILLKISRDNKRVVDTRRILLNFGRVIIFTYSLTLLIYYISADLRSDSQYYLVSVALLAITGEFYFGFVNKLWVNLGNTIQRQLTISKISIFSAITSISLKVAGVSGEYNELLFASSGIAFALCCAGYMQYLKPCPLIINCRRTP